MKNFIKTLALLTIFYNLDAQAHIEVAVTQIVEHPSLNKIRQGITDTLRKEFGDELHIHYENAQGNMATATQIAQKFAGMDLDLIIPISTPSSQAVLSVNTQTPIVFTAVSDPVGAQLVKSLEAPGGNKTGVVDIPPFAKQLDFIKSILPDVKNVGYVYNPGEANSAVALERLLDLAPKYGINIVPSPVTKSSEVAVASQVLVGRVEAIFITTDNTVVSGLEALIKVCGIHDIPLFTSDPDSVDRGAYASYAYDQYNIGVETGKLAIRVLKENNAGDLPLVVPTKLATTINMKQAQQLGLPSKHEDK